MRKAVRSTTIVLILAACSFSSSADISLSSDYPTITDVPSAVSTVAPVSSTSEGNSPTLPEGEESLNAGDSDNGLVSSDNGGLVEKKSVKQLSVEADHIFVGQVLSVQSDWNSDKTSINTTFVFRVEYYLKSTTFQKEFLLVVPGGTVGEVSLIGGDAPSFKPNERVLLFINGDGGEGTYITGSWQGVYFIEGSEAVQREVNQRLPLSELEALIRESTSTVPLPAYAGALILKRSVGELTKEADRIVVAQVTAVESQWNNQGSSVDTTITLNVQKTLKGQSQEEETLVFPGGEVGEFQVMAGGVPNFFTGERVLLFLNTDGSLTGLWQGKYSLSGDKAFQPETGIMTPLSSLEQKMNEALKSPVKIEDSPEIAFASFTTSCDAWDTTNDTFPIAHWVNPDNAGTGAPTGNEFVRLMFDSLNAWQALPNSWINLGIAGTTSRTANDHHFDGNNDIVWTGLESFILAQNWCATIGGIRVDSDTEFDNSNRTWTITAQSGLIDLRSVAEHEFGHGIGVGHSDQTCDGSASTPLMCPAISSGTRKTILTDDSNAAASLYPQSGSPPDAPSGLAAQRSGASDDQASLSWTDNSGSELAFEIQRASGNCSATFQAVGTVGANFTAYVDDDHGVKLNSGDYCYRVKALNIGGDSSFSCATLLDANTAPGAFNKTAPPDNDTNQSTSPTLNWGCSSGADSYQYCYDATINDSCDSWVSNATATSKALSGLTPGAEYEWHVRAVNTAGTTYSDGASSSLWTFTVAPGSNNLIFSDGFESGNLAAWDSAKTSSGDLKACGQAAINGSFGMCVKNKTNKPKFVKDSGINESAYSVQFNLDPNGLNVQNKKKIRVFQAKEGKTNTTWIQLRRKTGVFQIRALVGLDGGGKTKTSWYSITNSAHLVEVDWSASTAPGANNGFLTLHIDDVLKHQLSDLNNDTFEVKIIKLGFTNNPSKFSVSGIFYIDDFKSFDGGHIGP